MGTPGIILILMASSTVDPHAGKHFNRTTAFRSNVLPLVGGEGKILNSRGLDGAPL